MCLCVLTVWCSPPLGHNVDYCHWFWDNSESVQFKVQPAAMTTWNQAVLVTLYSMSCTHWHKLFISLFPSDYLLKIKHFCSSIYISNVTLLAFHVYMGFLYSIWVSCWWYCMIKALHMVINFNCCIAQSTYHNYVRFIAIGDCDSIQDIEAANSICFSTLSS